MRAPRSFLLFFLLACGGGNSPAAAPKSTGATTPSALATKPDVRTGYACPPSPSVSTELISQAGVFGNADFQISLDGRIVAARTTSHEIQIWSVTSGAKVATFTSPRPVRRFALRPDGFALATVSDDDKVLSLRDLQRGAFGTITLATPQITALTWSRDSRTLVVTDAQSTELVDASGSVRATIPVVAFPGGIAQDGRSLLANDGTMWDLGTMRPRWKAPHVPRTVTFSENGMAIAVASDDKAVDVLDVMTGAKKYQFSMHRRGSDVSLSPDGTSAAAYDDGEPKGSHGGAAERGIAIWNGPRRVRAWLANESENVRPAFSPDGKSLAFVSRHISEARLYDHEINVANVATGETRSRPNAKSLSLSLTGKLRGETPHWSADGTTLFEAGEAGLYAFDATTGGRRIIGEGVSDELILGDRDVVWGPDDASMVILDEAGDRQMFRSIAGLWDLKTGALRAALDAREGGNSPHAIHFSAAEFAPDGSQIALAREDGVVMWDGKSKEPTRIFDGDLGDVRQRVVAFNPNGHVLATGSRTEIRLWDPRTGARIRTIAVPDATIETIAFSVDGTRLAVATNFGSGNAQVHVYDAETGTLAHTLRAAQKASTGNLHAVHWGPKGRALVSVDGAGQVALWNPTTDDPPQILLEKASVGPSVLSGDGNLLFMGSDTVDVWDLRTGTRVRELPGDGAPIKHLRLSHDGNAVAVVRVGHIDVYRISDLAHVVLRTPSVFKQHEGLTAIGDGGTFAGSPAIIGALRVRSGASLLEVRPLVAEEVRALYRPSLVADLAAGCPVQAAGPGAPR